MSCTKIRLKAKTDETSLDAFSLLDKVLLHEMTHARGAYIEYKDGDIEAEGLIDVTSPERLLGIWKWPAYGWKGATALARQGDDLGEYAAPDNNADTIALFASGKLFEACPGYSLIRNRVFTAQGPKEDRCQRTDSTDAGGTVVSEVHECDAILH